MVPIPGRDRQPGDSTSSLWLTLLAKLKLEGMSDVTADPLSSPAPGQAVALGRPAQPRLTGCQRVIMVLLLGIQFMLAIDFSILNVALPSIGAGLHIGNGQPQWAAIALALPAAGFTLLFGRASDIAGRHRMLAGLALRAGTGS